MDKQKRIRLPYSDQNNCFQVSMNTNWMILLFLDCWVIVNLQDLFSFYSCFYSLKPNNCGLAIKGSKVKSSYFLCINHLRWKKLFSKWCVQKFILHTMSVKTDTKMRSKCIKLLKKYLKWKLVLNSWIRMLMEMHLISNINI